MISTLLVLIVEQWKRPSDLVINSAKTKYMVAGRVRGNPSEVGAAVVLDGQIYLPGNISDM